MDNGKYVRYTPEQVEALERLYHDCPKPSSMRRQQLIRECPILSNIEPKQIKVWFQNRRYYECLLFFTLKKKNQILGFLFTQFSNIFFLNLIHLLSKVVFEVMCIKKFHSWTSLNKIALDYSFFVQQPALSFSFSLSLSSVSTNYLWMTSSFMKFGQFFENFCN